MRETLSPSIASRAPGASRSCPNSAPHNGDYIVDKRRFSSFFQTELVGLLNGLCTELIVVSGVTANACVLTTVIDAFQYDFHTVTIQDCVSSKVGLLLDENYNDMMRLYKFYSNPLRLDSFPGSSGGLTSARIPHLDRRMPDERG